MIKDVESNKTILIIEISIFVIIVILNAFNYLPITQTIYLLPIIWIALKWKKEKFSNLGLIFKKKNLLKLIIYGIVLGVLLELFAAFVTTPIIANIFDKEPGYNDLQIIKGSLTYLLLFTILSWILGAFGEEICFRGYLMNRLAKVFGNSNSAWIWSLILSSAFFGWGHTEQGITGWIQEGLSGLLLGIMYLASGKNLVLPIVSHGISNTIAFILIYYGNYPGIS